MIEVIGWLSTICAITGNLPQVYKSLKTQSVHDLSAGFLLLWFMGTVFGTIYCVYGPDKISLILLLNFIMNGVCSGILGVLKIKEFLK